MISESRETTFDYDIADPARLEQILDGLVERLCAALVEQQRCGRTIGIKIRLDDFSTHTRARTLAEPVTRPSGSGRSRCELLRRFAPSAAGAPARRPRRRAGSRSRSAARRS